MSRSSLPVISTPTLGLGDHLYPAKALKDGPAPGGKYATLDEIIMDADGFACVLPERSTRLSNGKHKETASVGLELTISLVSKA